MLPEAVPIINQGAGYLPRLVFTSKLAIELDGEVDQRFARKIKSLGKEVIGIVRTRDRTSPGIPRISDNFDRVVIIMNSRFGILWLKYVMEFSNTIVGLTLDALMKFVDVKPHLLDLPSELFIDPIINDEAQVIPKELPKPVINWLLDYIESGGDLYVLIRDRSISSIDLLMRSRLVFTYDAKLAEMYNSMVKGGLNGEVSISSNCDLCTSSQSPLCMFLCPNVDIIRELRVD
jgi:hypothetical protein